MAFWCSLSPCAMHRIRRHFSYIDRCKKNRFKMICQFSHISQSGNKFIMELQGSNLCVDPSGQVCFHCCCFQNNIFIDSPNHSSHRRRPSFAHKLTNGAIALRNCTTLIGGGGGGAMSMIDSALLSARGDHLVAQQQSSVRFRFFRSGFSVRFVIVFVFCTAIRPSLMHWASSWQGLWFQGVYRLPSTKSTYVL
jgi:hypothetical protein